MRGKCTWMNVCYVMCGIDDTSPSDIWILKDIKNWLNLGVVTYAGLATGALLWGCVSDRVGRRRTLLTALTVAAIFDLMAAIMPSFGTFLTARLLGGIG